MEEINKFRTFNRLKSIYRFCSVGERKETTAEHTWACLMLADFFLTKYNFDLDRLKVYELLMYHDVVEIEAGDTPLHPNINSDGKKEKEEKAAEELKKLLPEHQSKKFELLFDEYENQKTKEARFAKAIDALEAVIHELDYKTDWKDWTKEFLIEKKEKYFEEFSEIKISFNDIVCFLEDNGYFNQK